MKRCLLIVAVVLLFVHGAAVAVNLRWLENSAVRYFSDEDWRLANGAADEALESRSDGEAVEWHNPKTGNSGRAVALRSLERAGNPCRELAVENRAKGMAGRSVFLFCQQPAGEWKIVPAGGKPDGVATDSAANAARSGLEGTER